MKTYQRRYSLLVVGALLFLSGCKLMRPVEQASGIKTPPAFADQSDSTGIGSIQWRSFFQDQQLVALIDTALQQNLDLRMAAQRIEQARTNILIAQGAMLPAVTGEISGGGRKFGDYTMDGVGNYDTNFSDNIDADRRLPAPFLPDYFVGLRSSWEIDIWGKLKTQKKAAYTRFLASEKARQAIVTGLIAQIASSYYELIALDAELNIIRKNIILQQSAVETVKIQKEGGRANELGVRQLTAQLLNTQSLEFEIQQKITETENNLNLLLGRFPQPIARGTAQQQTFPQTVVTGIPANMLKRRPDIQQAQLDLLANYSEQQAAQLAFLPSLNITAFLGFNAFKSNLLFSPGSIAYNALGGLVGPLVNRKALKAGQKRSEAASLEALYAYNKSVLNGFQEVSTSLKKIENTKRINDFKTQEVEVLQQAVATSKDLFLTGYASYLEVITAQRSVLEAELNLTEVQKQQFLGLIELYRSLGGGWE
ncbi:Toluene efflux pump outer membrane protein TtgI [Dyadobacter sp. CECT 9623]|uniref:Toluene efflux pump outer membrane protein TtgI n=1 Tax=Dyadobacter linearis TaxID=2823330 RepID=A0ABN7R787_9BACT|nr:efflux transporter outer membrane subunit [Dyadobacter sp. CECT 9623]CAG5069853.1 Toluene efflux pump outer membrane protein TtgI [Dyadobacter sp. CECT 9623]